MKLTTQRLRFLIKEELQAVLKESMFKGMSDEELEQQYDMYAYGEDPYGTLFQIKDEFEARGMLPPDERMSPGRPEASQKGKMNLADAEKTLKQLYKQKDNLPERERGLAPEKELDDAIEQVENYINNIKSGKALE